VDAAAVDGVELTAWEEAVERAVTAGDIAATASDRERMFPIEIPGGRDVEMKTGADGRAAARIVRQRWPISGRMAVRVEPCGGVSKVAVRVENTTPWTGGAERSIALRQSMLGVHVLLALEDGAFLSAQDPPPEVAALTRSCVNDGSWPVLAGPEGSRNVLLCSPIILYDHPAIAPESPGHLFDATEIDELLTLRVMTLTDQEKREARNTDERTRRLVDRADATPADVLERMHGTVRDAVPADASVGTPHGRVTRGSRVRLQPNRRADAIDMFLEGRVATVAGVYRTLEDEAYVAVTIDDDPGADLRQALGRFFYFAPDEIVLLGRTHGSVPTSDVSGTAPTSDV
jgi:hypothetical protein